MRQLVVWGLVLLINSGCAQRTIYNWGSYEDDLYAYYKSPRTPENHRQYMEKLSKLIEQSKNNEKAVPPGIYAEYGYGLYETSHYQEAIQYFEKEKSRWPEAAPLMERMISNVRAVMTEEKQRSQGNK